MLVKRLLSIWGLRSIRGVMVRHGEDHVHLVVSRVSDLGEVLHGRHDRRNAQRACTALEIEPELESAPRRKQPQTVEQSVHAERNTSRPKPASWRNTVSRHWRGFRKFNGSSKQCSHTLPVVASVNQPHPKSGR